jgi:hypothetical protein
VAALVSVDGRFGNRQAALLPGADHKMINRKR